MNLNDKVYVAGHQGLVGSALMRVLCDAGYTNLVTRTFTELDLRNQAAVNDFFTAEGPDYVFVAAARVGGIAANMKFPADFIYDNLVIQTNVLHAAFKARVKRLLFLGSSCIYPRECPQPIVPAALLTGPLEPTNEPYAVAKIAGIKLCQAYNQQYGTSFIVAMPTNLYGPGDNFDLETGHVLPALIAKFVAARTAQIPEVTVWGTGRARREFLYVDDLAKALVFLMQHDAISENAHINARDSIVNIGVGTDITIAELVDQIRLVTGYQGDVRFDTTRPDGTPRKLLDSSRITALGWSPATSLPEGILRTMVWYEKNRTSL